MKNKLLIAFIFLSSQAFSAESCKSIFWTDGATPEIYAKLNHYTHVILPENILEDTDEMVGNPDLWSSYSAGPHLYIKPTNATDAEGGRTSLSAIGESGKSYDYKVVRHANPDSICYKVEYKPLSNPTAKRALAKTNKSGSDELASLWRDKYNHLQRSQDDATKKAVRSALQKYRYHIYTRYSWRKGGGFIGKDVIGDIYDDGRFTYIRVNRQNKGLMMVEAKLAGQTEIIEASFDPKYGMYTISGIFPELMLKYGKTKIKVQRGDSFTKGEF